MQVSLLVGVTRNSLPKSKQSVKDYEENLCNNNDLLLYHINKKIVFCINSFSQLKSNFKLLIADNTVQSTNQTKKEHSTRKSLQTSSLPQPLTTTNPTFGFL